MKAEKMQQEVSSRTIQSKLSRRMYIEDNRGKAVKQLALVKRCNKSVLPNSGLVMQRVLITDIPNAEDFSQLTDLAIWWAMAAEYHIQQDLASLSGVPKSPLHYIKPLYDYGEKRADTNIHVDEGDEVRMLTHGALPDTGGIKHPIGIDGDLFEADEVIANINACLPEGKSVTPLYCFMGNNPSHAEMLPGIGEGPMLAPTIGSVSLKFKGGRIVGKDDKLVNLHPEVCPWKDIIDEDGCWVGIDKVGGLRDAYRGYVGLVGEKGVHDTETIDALKRLLDLVYSFVNPLYNSFTEYLIEQQATTGQGPSLWPDDQ